MPTNKQIANYIYEWIQSFDGNGLIITDDEPILKALEQTDFETLRQMFAYLPDYVELQHQSEYDRKD